MQRVYGVIDDEVFHRMNNAVDETSLSRAAWIGTAITEKLQRKDRGEDLDAMKLSDEVRKLLDENQRLNDELIHHKQLLTSRYDKENDEAMKLRDENKRLSDEIKGLSDEKSRKITLLNDELAMKNDELDKFKQQIKQANSEATERWQETKGLKSEITKLKKDIDDAKSANLQIKDELLKQQSEVGQLAKIREELAAANANRDRFQEALKVRDDDIAYFKSHISQLTQTVSQLSLPPSQEEAKKNGWSWWPWRRN